jgi:hypothetical protein
MIALFSAFQRHTLVQYRNPAAAYKTGFWAYLRFNMSLLSCVVMGMLQIGTLFSIRRLFRARPIVIFILTLCLYCQLGRWVCRFFEIPYRESPSLDYPIWHSVSWFFTAHTITFAMTVVLYGCMLAMSWVLYALFDWLIIGVVTFTHCGGPLGLGEGKC